MNFIIHLPKMLWRSVYDMVNHDGLEHAGYLSFLLMLTIFPFLVFITALLGFFGNEQLGNLLVNIILNSSWASFIDSLKPRILEITSTPPQSLLTIAILSALWTASSIFEGIRTILNRAYRVTETPNYLLRRLFSIIEFLIAISFSIGLAIILVVVPQVSGFVIDLFSIKNPAVINFLSIESGTMRFVILVGFAYLLVANVYHKLPNRKSRLISAFPGTILVMAGWYLASFLFKYYLVHFPQVNVIYGSIAGVIISLLYFYICSIIFIVGAEFNYYMEKFFRMKK
ncbi:MAG: ribonuclease [Candidatus Midichloriaceae bacterium]|nr:ribonuclease [Candidatus Midichloriaceae bacterium]